MFSFCIDNAKVNLKQYHNCDTKNSYVLTRFEPRVILKLFLNFSDFEPQYTNKLYSYKRKSVSNMVMFYLVFFVINDSSFHLPFEKLNFHLEGAPPRLENIGLSNPRETIWS